MSLLDIMDALATQLSTEIAVDDLQVQGRLVWNPTPPAIDIYPDEDVFQETIAFGATKSIVFTVRARVNTPDHYAAQDLLIAMMDSASTESVEAALFSDRTLSGTVSDLKVEGPSGFTTFVDPGGPALLGCTWRVELLP